MLSTRHGTNGPLNNMKWSPIALSIPFLSMQVLDYMANNLLTIIRESFVKFFSRNYERKPCYRIACYICRQRWQTRTCRRRRTPVSVQFVQGNVL